MSRAVAVLRPEPGNAATAARLAKIGLTAIRLPLFDVRALDWAVPEPAAFDSLILTSANAVRFTGPDLARLAFLPVLAVGQATADAARAAGLTVAMVGQTDATALIASAEAAGIRRALHLGARERILDAGGIVAQAIPVYASEPQPVARSALMALMGSVVLLHSARAAARLSALLEGAAMDRATIGIAAISRTVADAAGPGWQHVAIAPAPSDVALVARAAALAD